MMRSTSLSTSPTCSSIAELALWHASAACYARAARVLTVMMMVMLVMLVMLVMMMIVMVEQCLRHTLWKKTTALLGAKQLPLCLPAAVHVALKFCVYV